MLLSYGGDHDPRKSTICVYTPNDKAEIYHLIAKWTSEAQQNMYQNLNQQTARSSQYNL